jgi:hypothetical protein
MTQHQNHGLKWQHRHNQAKMNAIQEGNPTDGDEWGGMGKITQSKIAMDATNDHAQKRPRY